MSVLDSFALVGLRALVTGGGSGIGGAMAYALAQAGADVVIVGRTLQKLDDALPRLQTLRPASERIVCDLTAPGVDFDALAQSAGAVDIIVNAAGVNLREPAEAITSESWDQTHDINLKTPFFLSRCFIEAMRLRGWGRIINVASLQSSRAMPRGLAYGASKGGVAQLTRAMAEAWSGDGINANAIAPGYFRTPLTQSIYEQPEVVEKLAAQTAVGRNGELEDLHGVTVFLASRASDYITGQMIYVDGGFTAR